jgi:hypothetical protein
LISGRRNALAPTPVASRSCHELVNDAAMLLTESDTCTGICARKKAKPAARIAAYA